MPAGVVDGEPVDQTITNAAFLFKNSDDSSTGVYTLSAPSSGPSITDIQNTINVILFGAGGTQSTPATAYSNVPSNTVAQGDTLNTAISKLARKFYGLAASGGHTHSGVDGDGAQVSAVLSLAATGSSPLTGAVTLIGSGFVDLNQVGQSITIAGLAPGLPDVLAVNNSASAGFDMTGGAIVDMSYTDWENAGFPPGNPASGHVYFAPSADGFFYKKVHAGTITRVEGTIAASGNAAIYGDAVLVQGSGITLSQSGQNITITAAASGSAVSSFAASGQSALTGAVTISGGANITLTESGQNVAIAVSGVIPASGIGLGRTITSQSASAYTFALSDGSAAGGNPLTLFTSASAVTATIPTQASVAWPTGTQIDCIQHGAGKVTFAAASGVTLNSLSSNKSIAGQYVGVSVIRTASDVWTLIGNLTA